MSKGNWCIENDFAAQRELAYYTEDKLGKLLCRTSELEKQFIELQSRYNELVDAVKKMRHLEEGVPSDIDEILYGSYIKNKCAARAEVDRMIAQETL